MAELAERVDLVRQLADYAREGVVTLVYASRDEERNNAAVLRDHLTGWLRRKENA